MTSTSAICLSITLSWRRAAMADRMIFEKLLDRFRDREHIDFQQITQEGTRAATEERQQIYARRDFLVGVRRLSKDIPRDRILSLVLDQLWDILRSRRLDWLEHARNIRVLKQRGPFES